MGLYATAAAQGPGDTATVLEQIRREGLERPRLTGSPEYKAAPDWARAASRRPVLQTRD